MIKAKGQELIKVLQFIIAIIILNSMSSCYTCWVKTMPGKDFKRNYKNCYDEANTGLDSIIPINGFYYTIRNYDTWNHDLKRTVPKTDTVSMVFYSDGLFYSHIHWGNYIVNRDTIITNTFPPPCGMSWGGWESKYLINDDKTLKIIAGRPLRTESKQITEQYTERRQENRDKKSNAFFVQSDSLPNRNDCWLLDAEWFKCDK